MRFRKLHGVFRTDMSAGCHQSGRNARRRQSLQTSAPLTSSSSLEQPRLTTGRRRRAATHAMYYQLTRWPVGLMPSVPIALEEFEPRGSSSASEQFSQLHDSDLPKPFG